MYTLVSIVQVSLFLSTKTRIATSTHGLLVVLFSSSTSTKILALKVGERLDIRVKIRINTLNVEITLFSKSTARVIAPWWFVFGCSLSEIILAANTRSVSRMRCITFPSRNMRGKDQSRHHGETKNNHCNCKRLWFSLKKRTEFKLLSCLQTVE